MKNSEVSDPKDWSTGGSAIAVGDVLTVEWLDRIRSLMTAYNEAQRDALRYRWLRQAVKDNTLRVIAQGLFWNYSSRAAFDVALDELMQDHPMDAPK